MFTKQACSSNNRVFCVFNASIWYLRAENSDVSFEIFCISLVS